jgi:AGZA family xanthine/uracil permease-like MFS transporter
MGLNAFFAYTVCIGMGIDWRIALTAIFFEGIIFIVITLGGLRTLITRGIPKSLKMGIGVGIGLFIALIGLENGGMIVQNPSTLVELGSVYSLDVLITAFGILLISILYVLKVPGSVLFGILGSAGLSWLTGHAPFQGLVGRVPSIEPIFAKMVFEPDVIFTFGFITVMLTFFFLDLFDTAGTLIGLSNTSGFANSDGNLDRDKEAFMCDAIATTAGAVLGTSTTTAYIESAAGIAEGARTGFASVVTSIAMLAMLFFSPLAASIPGAATAPALIFVGFLMTRSATKIDWQDATESIPAFLTLLMIPLTYSISHGIAVGFIAYPIIKLFTGRFRDTNILTWILAGMFVFYLAIG